jgi:hypothetical protein
MGWSGGLVAGAFGSPSWMKGTSSRPESRSLLAAEPGKSAFPIRPCFLRFAEELGEVESVCGVLMQGSEELGAVAGRIH